MITRRHTLLLRACVLAGAALAATGVAAPAAASLGSVPAQITAYVGDPAGLRAGLDEYFGTDADGDGIAFDDTTKAGQLNRVWVFTAGFAAGDDSVPVVELTNEWTAPVTVAEQPVGLATIWIDPATESPDLADFGADPALAERLSAVPDDAALVRDAERGAWFALAGDVLTP
ncbi:MAG TPA: hypothetical protein VN200_04980, partial [Rhodoglobus sp.]|nr:hypothetical protein [Rhodoglobus sp.]